MSPFVYNVHVYEGEVVSADNTAVFSGEDELNKGVELIIPIKGFNVHIWSNLLQHTLVVGASSDLCLALSSKTKRLWFGLGGE